MSSNNLDKDWISKTAQKTGFSVSTIQRLIEVCYFQNSRKNFKKEVHNLISALQTPQKWFSLRINPVRIDKSPDKNVLEKIVNQLRAKSSDSVPNLIFIPVDGPFFLQKLSREIVVDKYAAESIMIGANLYIPGFLKPLPKFQKGEEFSIYSPNHSHVANGITQLSHSEIVHKKKGIGIKTTKSKYRTPSYRDSNFFSKGFISDHSFGPFLACKLLMEFYKDQNVIFDVCSAPGHMGCALSEMGYQKYKQFPTIVSIDRSKKRLEGLHQDIDRLGLKNFRVIPYQLEKASQSHPDLLNKADLLVFDPPCSALGTRPKLSIEHSAEDYRNFFLLQRRFVKYIFAYLKQGGIVLYTTCTLTLMENEGIVSLMNRKFGFEILDAYSLLSEVIGENRMQLYKDEFQSGIPRNEPLLNNNPFADSIHQRDLDRYFTLTKKDAKKLIRVNPKGDYSTGYFISLLRKIRS
ncbi:MAG: hypothetical protein JW776_05315 [Candidatus Lokiarchaeota archaeon]|nr:hypothetical protein [Candidatus Lokiarchaeota archaeon]